jgi:hydrogenase maturation protease
MYQLRDTFSQVAGGRAMNWPPPIRIVGMGSPSGDDAAGWEVVRELNRAKAWGSDFEFHALEGGQRLLEMLDGCGSLILIDAFESETKPGRIHRLEWPDPRIETLNPGTTHHVQPAEALQLASALGLIPGRVIVWAIPGEQFVPESKLSPAVVASLPMVVQRIVAELDHSTSRGFDDA